ncbi:MAG: hypothetical protein ACF8R7_07740 [Phycisphaerales bacterium JB039]
MWAQAVIAIIGVWLMAAPAVIGYGPPAAASDRIAGPIIAALSVVAIAEVTRPLRRASIPVGLWLIIAPLILSYPAGAALNSVLCGSAIVGLAQVRGAIRTSFGGGWSALWRPRDAPPQH